MSEPRRCALSPTELLRLDQWAAPLNALTPFGFGPYLVGSVMTSTTYRDVDVRQAIPDDLLPPFGHPDMLRVLNVAMSVWAQQATGLPVDFQYQPMSEWREHDAQPRNPLGSRWQTVHRNTWEAADHE